MSFWNLCQRRTLAHFQNRAAIPEIKSRKAPKIKKNKSKLDKHIDTMLRMKQSGFNYREIAKAVNSTSGGVSYYMRRHLGISCAKKPSMLISREQEVLQMVEAGKSAEHIANELGCTPTTVRTFLGTISR